MTNPTQKVRLDKYLWCIRLFKTRSLATDACDGGKVKYNAEKAKAAKNVKIGDVYEVKTEARKWVIRVNKLLENRLPFAEAILHYTDETPEEDKTIVKFVASSFETGKRQSKIGRPTKKQRRDIDGFTEN